MHEFYESEFDGDSFVIGTIVKANGVRRRGTVVSGPNDFEEYRIDFGDFQEWYSLEDLRRIA